jgi:hypothetical protein
MTKKELNQHINWMRGAYVRFQKMDDTDRRFILSKMFYEYPHLRSFVKEEICRLERTSVR